MQGRLPHHPLLHTLSTGYARRVGGFSTDWRVLPWALLEYSADGSWRLQSGDESWRTRPGQVLLVPPGTRHCLSVPTGSKDMHTVWCFLAADAMPGVDLLRHVTGPRLLPPAPSRNAARCLEELCDPACGQGATGMVRRRRCGYELLEILLALVGEPRMSRELLRVQPLLAWIEEHLAEDLDRERLAASMHLSASRFHAIFRQATGLAPHHYLLQRRLARAEMLMLDPTLTLAQIGGRCGFHSVHYFCRMFAKYRGSPPGRRRRHLQSLLAQGGQGAPARVQDYAPRVHGPGVGDLPKPITTRKFR